MYTNVYTCIRADTRALSPSRWAGTPCFGDRKQTRNASERTDQGLRRHRRRRRKRRIHGGTCRGRARTARCAAGKGHRDMAGGNSFYTAGATRIVHAGLDDLMDFVEPDERHGRTVVPPYTAEEYAADLEKVTEGRNDPELTEVLINESQSDPAVAPLPGPEVPADVRAPGLRARRRQLPLLGRPARGQRRRRRGPDRRPHRGRRRARHRHPLRPRGDDAHRRERPRRRRRRQRPPTGRERAAR